MISVIVPVYNTAEYLPKCLDSILAQTVKDFELVIVDDGSTDGSDAICDQYASRDSRIKVVHQENVGLVKARIVGFMESVGEWILFVDSDDWIAPNMLERMIQVAEENRADVVTSGVIVTNQSSQYEKYDSFSEGVYTGTELENLKNHLFETDDFFAFGMLPYLWNKLWRREVLEESLLAADDRVTVGEDVTIGFPAMLSARSVYVMHEVFYYYRQGNQSMLRASRDEEREYANAKRMCQFIYRSCCELGYEDLAEQGAKRLFINQIFTRAYEKVNQIVGCKGCYPFLSEISKPVVIYGAGAFGSAVYEYASRRFSVSAWIDGNAENLRGMGMPVESLQEAAIGEADVVIVPVFSTRASSAIRQKLIDVGVDERQIVLFQLSEEVEQELVGDCFEGIA